MDRARTTEALAKQDWEDIAARLVKFLKKRGASEALADDLTQQAFLRVFAFDSAWDPERHPVLLVYLMGVVKMLLFKERRGARRLVAHHHHDDDDDGKGAAEHADPRAFDEERVAAADLHSRRIGLLRARLGEREKK
jgi:DNA-directed RNA polymerase specialized sigma24 family protein